MNLNDIWYPKHSRRYLGGGSGAAQIASVPVPTPAPPVEPDNAASIQAEQDLAQQNLIKRSVKKTILAGDTGQYQGGGVAGKPTPVTGTNAKLG